MTFILGNSEKILSASIPYEFSGVSIGIEVDGVTTLGATPEYVVETIRPEFHTFRNKEVYLVSSEENVPKEEFKLARRTLNVLVGLPLASATYRNCYLDFDFKQNLNKIVYNPQTSAAVFKYLNFPFWKYSLPMLDLALYNFSIAMAIIKLKRCEEFLSIFPHDGNDIKDAIKNIDYPCMLKSLDILYENFIDLGNWYRKDINPKIYRAICIDTIKNNSSDYGEFKDFKSYFIGVGYIIDLILNVTGKTSCKDIISICTNDEEDDEDEDYDDDYREDIDW